MRTWGFAVPNGQSSLPSSIAVRVRPGSNTIVPTSEINPISSRSRVDLIVDWRSLSLSDAPVDRQFVVVLPDPTFSELSRHELVLEEAHSSSVQWPQSCTHLQIRHRSLAPSSAISKLNQEALYGDLESHLRTIDHDGLQGLAREIENRLRRMELTAVERLERHSLQAVESNLHAEQAALFSTILRWHQLTENDVVRATLSRLRVLLSDTFSMRQLDRMVEINSRLEALAQLELDARAQFERQEKLLLRVSYLLAGPLFVTSLWSVDADFPVPHGTGWAKVSFVSLIVALASWAAVVGEQGTARRVALLLALLASTITAVSLVYQF